MPGRRLICCMDVDMGTMVKQETAVEEATRVKRFDFVELTDDGIAGKSKTRKRSLYECFNAKVKGNMIYCAKGCTLQTKGPEPLIRRLERGAPLICSVCQDCPDFDPMGPPLRKNERGYNR